MDPHLLDKLLKLDATERLGDGRTGVRASVQYPERIDAPRDERRERLAAEFSQVGDLLHNFGGELDLQSMSVSGQSVEAVVPLDTYDEVEQAVRSVGCTLRVVMDEKIV